VEIKKIEKCRVCHSKELVDVHSLGNFFVSDFVEKPDQGHQAPLAITHCQKCSLLQLEHSVPLDFLYTRHYWYRSGVTDTMRKALRNITAQVEELTSLKAGDTVLDIGANDGTLLETYQVPGLKKVGCEPANNLVGYLREKTDYVIHDLWNYEGYEKVARQHNLGKARVVTAIGMFYDMEDPNQFIADIKKVLAEDGIFIAQLMCLASMLKKNDVGNICHEHLEYYSLESLRVLFEQNGLEIFKIEENEVNGGSYRLFGRHYQGKGIAFDEKFNTQDYRDFFDRINKNRDQCMNFIQQEITKDKKVYVYGASTKGNTILQYYGLDNKTITAAVERSPEKWGKFTVGTHIPIISEEEARAAKPDYFLVLPWAFFNEFYEREKIWRSKGGKFIVPFPEFRVVA